MTSRSAVLVENVAQALTWAIDDPSGHHLWNTSVFSDLSSEQLWAPTAFGKRRRGAEECKEAATVFDSSVIPPIGISAYLLRLSATFRCSDATFIAALIVVDRVLGYDGGRLPLTMRNVHRLFLGALVVAVKYHEDLVYANSHYAKSGGVRLREVNRLERTLLVSLDFDLGVSPEQYRLYEATLLNFSPPSPTGVPSGLGAPQKPADNKVPEPAQAAAPATAAAQASTAADDEAPPGANVDSSVTEQKATPPTEGQQGNEEDAASAPSAEQAEQQGDQKGKDAADEGAEKPPRPAASAAVGANTAAAARLAPAAAGYPAKPGSDAAHVAGPVATLPGLSANAIFGRPLGRGGVAEPVARGRHCAYAEMIQAHREIIKDFGGLVTMINGGEHHHALVAGSACVPCSAVDVTPPPPWAPQPQRAVLGLDMAMK
mmetsp:Transcript_67718/g.177596  ORF Transcript_67718/g.177596 Transcript_67718/m.177596 type:complete len:431 (+) Transcript_67718:259-1551(+)